MTKEEAVVFTREMRRVFDIVRLVDVSSMTEYSISEDGVVSQGEHRCYLVWKKEGRCENCVSSKAFTRKSRLTKFEFVDRDVYHVIAMYLEIEGEPYILELVNLLTDETLFGAYGKNQFVETISAYNKKLYSDPLTGAYNRRYYEEQLSELSYVHAVAIIDVDNFKAINDRYGHNAGDQALKSIVASMASCVREDDVVIRMGGDEFLYVFKDITRSAFDEKMEKLRELVSRTKLEEYPQIDLSVSIGGAHCAGKTSDAVAQADRMLYEAKQMKNTVRVKWD